MAASGDRHGILVKILKTLTGNKRQNEFKTFQNYSIFRKMVTTPQNIPTVHFYILTVHFYIPTVYFYIPTVYFYIPTVYFCIPTVHFYILTAFWHTDCIFTY